MQPRIPLRPRAGCIQADPPRLRQQHSRGDDFQVVVEQGREGPGGGDRQRGPAEGTGAKTLRVSDLASGSAMTGTSTSICALALPGQKTLDVRSPCAGARSKFVGQSRSSAYQSQFVGIFPAPASSCRAPRARRASDP